MRPVVPNLHTRTPGATIRVTLAALFLVLTFGALLALRQHHDCSSPGSSEPPEKASVYCGGDD
ncbi:MAG: hypothetical protein QOJ23_1164 [Actinomycetota bacterium]|jgi:hypothetical protein|nr:hypothetical protein [Actinomycetota bacterium]MDQ1498006.1 hypothetical protein [Actinomycetota bacterium]